MIALSRDARILVQSFEEAWYGQAPPDVEAYFRGCCGDISEAERDPFLHWLVRVDMEFRMRNQASPDGPTIVFLDNYVRAFPASFRDENVPDDLLIYEYIARLQGGAVPNLIELLKKYSASERLSAVAKKLEKELEDATNAALPVIPGHIILSEIGRGGMGIVYSALEMKLDRKVAVKLISPERVSDVLLDERFMREARTLAKLDSEKFLPIYDVGVATVPANCPFFTMRLIPGYEDEVPTTLQAALAKRSDVMDGLEGWLKVFKDVCDSVSLAHNNPESPILHRDLKPSNIVLDVNGRPWVIDWGLAKQSELKRSLVDLPSSYKSNLKFASEDGFDLTQEGMVVGTISYMSPEQANAQHERVNPSSDVFGLGAILCHILTGAPPYQASTPHELFRKAKEVDLSACRERLKECPDDYLRSVALSALNPKQGARYRTAAEMRDALEFWFDSRALHQQQLEMTRAKLPLKRRLRLLAMTAILLLMVAIAGYTWRYYDSYHSELSRQDQIETAEESIEKRICRVAEELLSGNLSSAQRTIEEISVLHRDDLSEASAQDIRDTEDIVRISACIEELMEERVLLRLDDNLSASELAFEFEKQLKDLHSLDERAARPESPLYQVQQSKTLLVMNELMELVSSEHQSHWLNAMELVNRDAPALRLRKSQHRISSQEVTELLQELRPSEFSPGILDTLLRRNAETPQEVLQTLRSLETLNRNNFWLSLYLAVSLLNAQDAQDISAAERRRNEAILWARTAIGTRPKSAVAMLILAHILNGNDLDEFERLAEAMKQHHPDSWMRYYVAAKAALANADARSAVGYLEQSLTIKGHDPFLLMQQAELLMALGELEQALEILENRLGDAADTIDALCLRAICHLKLEQFEQARKISDQLSADYSFSPRAKIVRAFISAFLGRMLEAKTLYEGIQVKSASDGDFFLAGLVLDIAEGDYESAYERVMFASRYGRGFDFWLSKGQLDASLGRFNDAEAALRESQNWLNMQNGRSFTVMGIEAKDRVPVLVLVVNWYASLDRQLKGMSPKEMEEVCNQNLSEPLIGRLKGYIAEYLAIRGEHAMATQCFEKVMPPLSSQEHLEIIEITQLSDRLRKVLDLPPRIREEEDLKQLQLEIQNKLATSTPEQQKSLMVDLMQFMNEVDLGIFPSTQGMNNLRLAAARSACLAAAGKSRGVIANDSQRAHWRSLASSWLNEELEICQQLDTSGQSKNSRLNRIDASRRLGQILTHRDFELLRHAEDHLSDPAEIARLKTFWEKVRKLYDQLGNV